MIEEITALAAALGAEEEDQGILLCLCEAAERELAGRLKKDLTPQDCGSAFSIAAAWMALAGLEAASAVSGVESFSAGNVTIRKAAGRPAQLRRQAEQLMAPYLADAHFVFMGVDG